MWRLVKGSVFVAVIWSAWWYAAARGIEAGWPYGLAELQGRGWTAEAVLGGVTGYPGRFETEAAEVALGQPRAGWAWRAPGVGLSLRSWNPADVTALWPAEQTITLPGERLTLSAGTGRSRLALIPGATLPLYRAEVELAAGALAARSGWRAAVAEARMALRRSPDRPDHYLLTLDAVGVEPPAGFLAVADPDAQLPPAIDALTLDATIGFDAPLNRFALDRRPQPTVLDLRALSIAWGALDIAASGSLAFDAEGLASGRITLSTGNWRAALALAIAAGLVAPEMAGTYESGLVLFAATSGTQDDLQLPLTLRDGQLSLGPIPLGPVPPVRLP